MDEQIIKTIRLPRSIVDKAQTEATNLGLTFADVVETALGTYFKMKPNPRTDILLKVAELLKKDYRDSYPQDVTLQVFRKIRSDDSLLRAYKAAISDPTGTESENLKATLHRQIGLCVRRVLGAKVIGRSVELDPNIELIKTHALLEPDN